MTTPSEIRARKAQVVLVTGAVGAIGSATMRAVTEAGYTAVGFDRRPADPRQACGVQLVVDVADEDELRDAVHTVRQMGPLSHVIGLAGGALPGEPETQSEPMQLDLDVFRRSVENNLVGQFMVVQATLPWMRESRGDDRSFAFTSSFNALSAQGMPGYSAAKAGLIGMMHALVAPMGKEGIRVNVVAPGTVRTPRTEDLYASTPDHFERLARGTAIGRVACADDISEAFMSLLRMRHVTGQVLTVDGGQTVIHR